MNPGANLQAADDEGAPEFPSYRDPGRLLVAVVVTPYFCTYRYEIEVLDYTGCCFWIQEGEGFEYWCDQHLDLQLDGVFLIEGIVGDYRRGDGWTTDDDVRWSFGLVTRSDLESLGDYE